MDARTILFYSDKFLMNAIEGLDYTHWEKGGVCGVWSVKNIIAHMTANEWYVTDVLGLFTGETEIPYLDRMRTSGATFNDDTVAERSHLSPAETLSEYIKVHETLMNRAQLISAETFREVGTIPWYGPEYSLDDFIVYSDYGHKREHGAEINAFRDRLR